MSKHADCPFDWCDTTSLGRDHFHCWEAPASGHPIRRGAVDFVDIALDFDEDEDDEPQILVMVRPEGRDATVDAGLTLNEATHLLLNLATAIRHASATQIEVAL
jgi:hypothetical protein